MSTNVTDRIERAWEAEDWATARKHIVGALRTDPHDHWLLTRLATTYYEERNYAVALEWSQKAFAEAPHCPLVLWDLAGALDMLGREQEALQIWRRLIRRGAKAVAEEECSEGIRWARSLVNDCRYRAALALFDLKRGAQGMALLQEHLLHRGPACPSIYPLASVKRRMTTLLAASDGARRLSHSNAKPV